MLDITKQVSKEQDINEVNIKKVIKLIKEEANTIPFIARYRKNETGDLTEDDIRKVIERWEYLNNLRIRKKEIIETLSNREILTPELEDAVNLSKTRHELLELYKPYKQKKKTRGMKADDQGLTSLAELFLEGSINTERQVNDELEKFVNTEKGVMSTDDALQGAKDIIAERLAQKADNRRKVKDLCKKLSIIHVELKDEAKDKNQVFKDYYDFSENLGKLPLHRMMAVNRGEKEDVLKVKFASPQEEIIKIISEKESKGIEGVSKNIIKKAATDSCKRLLIPSVERELRTQKFEDAQQRAINIFTKNLESLLMQPPIKGEVIMGVDPAYKTGCKLAVINQTGEMKEVDVIYPTPPHKQLEESEKKVVDLIEKYDVRIVAIGNGTASRETEEFFARTITTRFEGERVQYAIVSEEGASVYSASKIAGEEFSGLDVQERSAISIARRVLDPLAELVKIDPKSIGVGQYQHDVSKKDLDQALSFVVEKVVNQVGVDVNTTSVHLLRNISGLNKNTAENIVKKRAELGNFYTRKELKSVKGLGNKTYEQSVGFLRVLNGNNPLDKTAIHPESYDLAIKILDFMNMGPEMIGSEELKVNTSNLENDLNSNNKKKELLTLFETDIFTLKDILNSFKKPNFDPREKFDKPRLKKEVLKLDDLKEGMILEGEVKNVVDFGAFVDIGIKENGLIHVSNISDKYIKHPLEVVSVGNIVLVEIISIEKDRGRIGLRKVQEGAI